MSWIGYVPTGSAAGGSNFPQAGQPMAVAPSGSTEPPRNAHGEVVRAAYIRAATEFGLNPQQLRHAQAPAPPTPAAELNRQSAREQY